MSTEKDKPQHLFGDLGGLIGDIEGRRVHSGSLSRGDLRLVLLHGPEDDVFAVVDAIEHKGKTHYPTLLKSLRAGKKQPGGTPGFEHLITAVEKNHRWCDRLALHVQDVKRTLAIKDAARKSGQPLTSDEYASVLSCDSLESADGRFRDIASNPTVTRDNIRDVLLHADREVVEEIVGQVPRGTDTNYEVALGRLRGGESSLSMSTSFTRLLEALTKEPNLVDLVAAAKDTAGEIRIRRTLEQEVIRRSNVPLTTSELDSIVSGADETERDQRLQAVGKSPHVTLEGIRATLFHGPEDVALRLARTAPTTTIESYETTVRNVRSGTASRGELVSFQRLVEAVGKDPKLVDIVEIVRPQVHRKTQMIELRQRILAEATVPLTTEELDHIMVAGSGEAAIERLHEVEANPRVQRFEIREVLLKGSQGLIDSLLGKVESPTSADYSKTVAAVKGGNPTRADWASFNQLAGLIRKNPELVDQIEEEKKALLKRGVVLEEKRPRKGKSVGGKPRPKREVRVEPEVTEPVGATIVTGEPEAKPEPAAQVEIKRPSLIEFAPDSSVLQTDAEDRLIEARHRIIWKILEAVDEEKTDLATPKVFEEVIQTLAWVPQPMRERILKGVTRATINAVKKLKLLVKIGEDIKVKTANDAVREIVDKPDVIGNIADLIVLRGIHIPVGEAELEAFLKLDNRQQVLFMDEGLKQAIAGEGTIKAAYTLSADDELEGLEATYTTGIREKDRDVLRLHVREGQALDTIKQQPKFRFTDVGSLFRITTYRLLSNPASVEACLGILEGHGVDARGLMPEKIDENANQLSEVLSKIGETLAA